MLGLAEFLGIQCEVLALANVSEHAAYLEKTVPRGGSCFVVNPEVIKEWIGTCNLSSDLVSFLLSRFPHVLVHGLRVDDFDGKLVAALSRERLQSVRAINKESSTYDFSSDSKEICGAFSGLSFGPVNSVNDHVVVSRSGSDPALRQLISIGGQPFMAAVVLEGTAVLFLASEDVADVNLEATASFTAYFSRFVPYAMALRYAAADECWRPCEQYASIIVDDPLLRSDYGFLNFESLLSLMQRHNFHTSIGFIPHNFRRSIPRITRMFRENASRLSICYHGNDHTAAEFASTDVITLETMLSVAEHRMNAHEKMTGVHCDRVMVFPQEDFSAEALAALKSHNFYGVVNSGPFPPRQPDRPTISDIAQPAILRYEGFPIFTRKFIEHIQSFDIAFNLFFGRPILVGAHHEVFERPERVVEVAAKINTVAPQVNWSSPATAISNSILRRRVPDGTYHVRAYSGTVRISNDSDSIRHFSIEWRDRCDNVSVGQVVMDGVPCPGFEIDETGIRLSVELPPGSRTFSLVHQNAHGTVRHVGLRWNAQAFLRRRLSEVRDNYLSKSQHLLTAAKALKRCFPKV